MCWQRGDDGSGITDANKKDVRLETEEFGRLLRRWPSDADGGFNISAPRRSWLMRRLLALKMHPVVAGEFRAQQACVRPLDNC